MKRTAHTPGPWTCLYSPWFSQDDGEIPAFEVHADEHKVCDTNEDRTAEEQEANARLIAAAPELFEALEEALVLLEATADILFEDSKERGAAFDEYNRFHVARIRIRGVIARAKGGEA